MKRHPSGYSQIVCIIPQARRFYFLSEPLVSKTKKRSLNPVHGSQEPLERLLLFLLFGSTLREGLARAQVALLYTSSVDLACQAPRAEATRGECEGTRAGRLVAFTPRLGYGRRRRNRKMQGRARLFYFCFVRDDTGCRGAQCSKGNNICPPALPFSSAQGSFLFVSFSFTFTLDAHSPLRLID